MIKRVIHIGSPLYISQKSEQLVLRDANSVEGVTKTVPIEDIGVLILDHLQITITQSAIHKLLSNNVAVISCDATHHPVGLMLNLAGNTLQSAKFKDQIAAKAPLLKQLWQQTTAAKVRNQAAVLKKCGVEQRNMLEWARKVKSGDSGNIEARAAGYYWANLFSKEKKFRRNREGAPPNNLFNYGYAILRATVARSLVGSGLLPTLGIFHRNQYNHYCLADDIMEPYRPIVDTVVLEVVDKAESIEELTPEIKQMLLTIPAMDVSINEERSPLMIAVQRTTASLARCYAGIDKKVIYPELFM